MALTSALPAPPQCPPVIVTAMSYSLAAGGKRLRPLLTLAAADAVAQRLAQGRLARGRFPSAFESALPAACAVELIHTYSLIHDDLPAMDDDTLRRGRPTLHVAYGDGIAILAGDGLQAEAFALLAREPEGGDPALVARKLRVVQIVADAAGATGMVGGQAIDLQAAGQAPGHALSLDAEGLRAMHLRKTGALIRASAAIGAVMAGADPDVEAAVSDWGVQIGLAFQIVDDVLDVEGTADKLGKTAGKDARQNKPTYVSVLGLSRARALAMELRDDALAALDPLPARGGRLRELGEYIVARHF
mgnify:CR=1 FL=1